MPGGLEEVVPLPGDKLPSDQSDGTFIAADRGGRVANREDTEGDGNEEEERPRKELAAARLRPPSRGGWLPERKHGEQDAQHPEGHALGNVGHHASAGGRPRGQAEVEPEEEDHRPERRYVEEGGNGRKHAGRGSADRGDVFREQPHQEERSRA